MFKTDLIKKVVLGKTIYGNSLCWIARDDYKNNRWVLNYIGIYRTYYFKSFSLALKKAKELNLVTVEGENNG